jgi:hypothetical protein
MSIAGLRNDEQLGLGIALAVHLVLLAALAYQATRPLPLIPPPVRMAASFAQTVSLVAEAPEISQESQEAPAEAAQVGDQRGSPPDRSVVSRRQQQPPPDTSRKRNESSLPSDFLKDRESQDNAESRLVPADQIGRRELVDIQRALARQVAPFWTPPSGAEADKLVTIVTFDLDQDGSLRGRPRVVGQEGVTDANRTQAGRHQELAVRAVQLAAPFELPPQYYNAWRRIRTMRFDWDMRQ